MGQNYPKLIVSTKITQNRLFDQNRSKSPKNRNFRLNSIKINKSTKRVKITQNRHFQPISTEIECSRPNLVKITISRHIRPKLPKIDFFDQNGSKSVKLYIFDLNHQKWTIRSKGVQMNQNRAFRSKSPKIDFFDQNGSKSPKSTFSTNITRNRFF